MQEIGFILQIMPLGRVNDPIGAPGCQNLRSRTLKLSKKFSSGPTAAGLFAIDDPLIHAAVVERNNFFVQMIV